MDARRRLFIAFALLTPVGCAPAPGSPAAMPMAEKTEARDVEIDLAPAGMAATMVAPEGAQARANPDGVELEGGDGFHLLVRRGSLDPLVEKARIVREYGEGFRRFVRDLGDEVVYETSFAGELQFHFFMVNDEAPAAYHCRTPDDGVTSLDLVERMIAACRQVRHRDDVEPRDAVVAAE